MSNYPDNIMDQGDCISEEVLLNYLAGKLSHAEQHRVEKHLMECGFCNDAFEGLRDQQSQQVASDLKTLDKRIDARIKGDSKTNSSWIYKIAAVVAIAALVGGGVYYLNSAKESQKIFVENFEPYKDTVKSAPQVLLKPTNEEMSFKENEKSGGKQAEQKVVSKNTAFSPLQTSPGYAYNVDGTVSKQETFSKTTTASPDTKGKDRNDAGTKAEEKKENTVAVTGTTMDDKNPERDEYTTKTDAMKKSAQPSAAVQEEIKENKTSQDKKALNLSLAESNRSTADTISANQIFLESGIQEYKAKNYSAAIVSFDKVLQKESSNTEALFYSGISHLGLDETDAAIKDLENILKNSPNKFSDSAKWYLSLAFIKKNKTSKAKKLLEDLSAGESEYKSNAKKMLEEIK